VGHSFPPFVGRFYDRASVISSEPP
jgi:hypothetical protein